jgi:hypothetical protein
MEEIMFGLTGGERETDLARPKAYGIDAQQKWPTLMMIDLSQIKTEERLGVAIGERYSPKHAEADADVTTWMQGEIC